MNREQEISQAVNSIFNTLNGTCSNESPEELLREKVSDLTDSEVNSALYAIDDIMFWCTTCGWWHGTCEHTEEDTVEPTCRDCAGDEYE